VQGCEEKWKRTAIGSETRQCCWVMQFTYLAEVNDALARCCPAMSSEMAHFALMKCNKIKHAYIGKISSAIIFIHYPTKV
jgi:hypothetical protein